MTPAALQRPPAPLRPLATGAVHADAPVLLPFMAPRLQGDLLPDGSLTVSIWGAGHIATLSLGALAGPVIYAPNRATASGWELHVAQSAPVLVVRGRAASGPAARLAPARRCAWWHDPGPSRHRAPAGGDAVDLPWGTVLVQRRGTDLVVAAGADRAEAEAGLALSVDRIVAEADAYVARCDRMPDVAPLLRSMIQQSVHAALSSVRRGRDGAFAGLAAGQAYSAPARTYFRDGYWIAQALLALDPDAVAGQIDLLAAGIQPDGEAPSAVILTGPAQSAAWERFRTTDPVISREHLRPGDWWSDHFDSPLMFVLLIADHVRATGDMALLRRHWPLVRAVHARYTRLLADGLPAKPRNDRDWADNVYREGAVGYDLGLWIGMLDAIAALGRDLDADLADTAARQAAEGRRAIRRRLWLDDKGWCAEYLNPDGYRESHLALDTVTLLRYDALGEAESRRMLQAIGTRLYSDRNGSQPWGDWGVLCAFPPYARRTDIRAKSAFPYRYHNGADWPYLDGVLARELLRRGLPGWRYPLLRWWQSCLEQGWMGAVEYFSPPFGRGSLLQGWSSTPAAAALEFADRVRSGDHA